MQETDVRTRLTRAPVRRDALRLGLAAFTTGVGSSAAASASITARPGSDAERIALCAFIVENDRAQRALHAERHSLEDEWRTEPALQVLFEAAEQALDRLVSLPGPHTLEGARAMAWAAITIAPRGLDGTIMPQGSADGLAFSVAEFMAKG